MQTPYTVHRSPDAPIVLTVVNEGYSVSAHMALSTAEVKAYLDEAPEPLYYILDLTAMTTDLDELITATSRSARGDSALWHHPAIREIIFVSESPMVKLAAKGLNSAVYGNLDKVCVLGSVYEALRYCQPGR